jgi:hypothetical protein
MRVVYWWSIWMGFVSTILVLCILLDWFGHAGWGYPWYAGVMAIALLVVAIGVGKLARHGLKGAGRSY